METDGAIHTWGKCHFTALQNPRLSLRPANLAPIRSQGGSLGAGNRSTWQTGGRKDQCIQRSGPGPQPLTNESQAQLFFLNSSVCVRAGEGSGDGPETKRKKALPKPQGYIAAPSQTRTSLKVVPSEPTVQKTGPRVSPAGVDYKAEVAYQGCATQC